MRRKRWPRTRKPRRAAVGQGGAELPQRRVAPEQVHRVGEGAAAGELDRIESAVGLEERGDPRRTVIEPQAAVDAVGHVELGRHCGLRPGGVAHGARGRCAAKRARFSTLPPNWSSRRFSLGLRKALRR